MEQISESLFATFSKLSAEADPKTLPKESEGTNVLLQAFLKLDRLYR
jgi:hypothetical protein